MTLHSSKSQQQAPGTNERQTWTSSCRQPEFKGVRFFTDQTSSLRVSIDQSLERNSPSPSRASLSLILKRPLASVERHSVQITTASWNIIDHQNDSPSIRAYDLPVVHGSCITNHFTALPGKRQ